MLRGLAASPGVYEGTARLISGPAEFERIVQGDVLVTMSTTEAFNILLPLLGAIVTDSGGLLSHSAIVAREYGIPGVVGTRQGTELIADGARVRVDGDGGRGDRPHVSGVLPLREVADTSVFGSKAVGLGEAVRAGLPVPDGFALSGQIVEAVAAGDEDVIETVTDDRSPARRAVRGALVRRRRGRRRRELRRAARDAPERPDGRRAAAGARRDLVVGELGLGDQLPQARRPLHAPERRGRRPAAARPGHGRRHVHAQPGDRRRRADDRGEHRARRGGRRRSRHPRQLPARPRLARAREPARA